MITTSPKKATRQERYVVMKPPTQRADRGRNRGRGADERVGPALHRALEVPVDQRLHRGK